MQLIRSVVTNERQTLANPRVRQQGWGRGGWTEGWTAEASGIRQQVDPDGRRMLEYTVLLFVEKELAVADANQNSNSCLT